MKWLLRPLSGEGRKSVMPYPLRWCSMRNLYFTLRSLCIPLEEDIRRVCEDSGDVDILRALQEIYPRLDLASMHFRLPRREGYTPLTLAARCGHLRVVQFLVEEERANVDECDVTSHYLSHCFK